MEQQLLVGEYPQRANDRRIILDATLMVLLVATNAVFQILWKDLVASANGLGWDGVLYSRLVQDPRIIFQVIPERAQRILPSLTIYFFLEILRVAKTVPNIIFSFQVMNGFLLVVDVFAYLALCKYFQFSRVGRWLGFLSLFFCFSSAKFAFHSPVQTDIPGFSLALWGTLFALRQNFFRLTLVFLLASFTWSTLNLFFFPLIIFMPGSIPDPNPSSRQPQVVALVAMFAYLLAVYLSYSVLGYRPYATALAVQENWIILSEVIGAAYIYAGFFFLFKHISVSDFNWRKSLSVRGIFVILAVVVITKICLMLIVHNPNPRGIFSATLQGPASIFMRSITLPGIFLVSHAVYYGPIFILGIFFWDDICQEAAKLGDGTLVFLAITFVFSITSESRHLLQTLPLITCLCVAAIQKRNLQTALLPITAIGTLLASKIWYRITIQMFSEFVMGGYLSGPLQRYYMQQGPWMSIRMYLIQGVIALLFAISIFFILQRRNQAPTFDKRRLI